MFGMGTFEADSYNDLRQKQTDIEVKLVATEEAVGSGQTFIRSSGFAISMGLAAIAAAHGKLSPGDFVLINSYIHQLFGPLTVRSCSTPKTSDRIFMPF